MKSQSLKSKLLTWLVTPLLLFGCLSSYITYKLAVASVDEMNDDFLLNSADSVLARIKTDNGTVQVDLPAAAQDHIFYAITIATNSFTKFLNPMAAFLSGDPTIPGPKAIEVSGPTFYRHRAW